MTLLEKLLAAGLPIANATEDGVVSGISGVVMTSEQFRQMNDVCMEHLHPAEHAVTARVRNRQATAHAAAKAIPNWASWTQAQWQTYFNANLSDTEADTVTSLATARVMIKRQNLVILNLVKMVIALRDAVYPDLPE